MFLQSRFGFVSTLLALSLAGCGGGGSSGGWGDLSTETQVFGFNPPSNLVATAVSNERIDLTWKDNAQNEEGFIIKRSEDGVQYFEIDTLPQGKTSFSDKGLPENTTYFYIVAAYNQEGKTAQSDPAEATTLIIPWAASYGGSDADNATSICPTKDGGYIVAGTVLSFGKGLEEIWVLKLDSRGAVEWEKAFGGEKSDRAGSVIQTLDGGFIVAGITQSPKKEDDNALVLKLNSKGNIDWQKVCGTEGHDMFHSVIQTKDNGYILVGATSHMLGGKSDSWLVKLDPDGFPLFQKVYAKSLDDEAIDIKHTHDGGYIVTGNCRSHNSSASSDIWLMKLDTAFSVLWQRSCGGSDDEKVSSICPTKDGGYVVAGYTDSLYGSNREGWLVKFSPTGAHLWQKSYGWGYMGPPGKSTFHSVLETSDGGLLAAGTIFPDLIDEDVWLLKLDASGDVEWERAFDCSSTEMGTSMMPACEGGYALAGSKTSSGSSDYEYWVLKLNQDGTIDFNPSSGAEVRDIQSKVTNTSFSHIITWSNPITTKAGVSSSLMVITNTQCIKEQQAP